MVDTIPAKMVPLHTPAEWLELVEQSLAKVGNLSPAAAENDFIRAYAASNLYGAVAFPTLVLSLSPAFHMRLAVFFFSSQCLTAHAHRTRTHVNVMMHCRPRASSCRRRR